MARGTLRIVVWLALVCVTLAQGFSWDNRVHLNEDNPDKSCLGLSKLMLNQTGYVQYVEYFTQMPQLTEFTMQYWFFVLSNTRSATTFNYALDERVNLNNLTVQVHPDQAGSRWSMVINDVLVHDTIAPPLTVGQWHHAAHSWKAVDGAWNLYVDGQLCGTGNTYESVGLVIPGGGVAVSGQHQETANTMGMDQGKGLEGWFTHFNMWSTCIGSSPDNQNLVAGLVRQCQDVPRGDVISWPGTPRKGYGGSTETPARNVCGHF